MLTHIGVRRVADSVYGGGVIRRQLHGGGDI